MNACANAIRKSEREITNRRESTNKRESKSEREVTNKYETANSTSVYWYVDSGASNHMMNEDSYMYNTYNVENKKIVVANRNELSVECAGDVDITVFGETRKECVTVKNVEHVPNLCANLLSVRQMTKNGKRVIFDGETCKIFNKNEELIASATIHNDLYRLDSEASIKESNVFLAGDNFDLWHRRMGHICNNNLRSVKEACFGVIFTKGNNEPCVTCVKGKQTRRPHREEGSRATELLELIHTDVVGPLKDASFSGTRYLVTFVDDFSRKLFVHPIRNKSDVFDTFVEFKKMVENQCSKKIKVLRSDNGGEYLSNRFSSFLKSNGIVHQTTCPYSPEQNGVAERINRTLIERVRCMLIDSGLDNRFWAEAVVTAGFLINRVPCRSQNRSPEEIWSGRRPNLKFLRVFGCPALVHIPKEKRRKLDVKSIECIMMGYSATSKAYRLFNPRDSNIVISRDVVFLENGKVNMKSNLTNDFYYPELLPSESVNSGESVHNDELTEVLQPTISETVIQPIASETVVQSTDCDTDDSEYYEDTEWPHDTPTLEVREDCVNAEWIPNAYERQLVPVVNEVRRSDRIAQRTQESQNFCAMQFVSGDPQNVKDAMSSNFATEWKTAMQEEMNSLLENNTWVLTTLPSGENAIKSRWVFKTKYDGSGNPMRWKARLVAKGFTQREGIDYTETFAPVVRYESIRFLISLAVKHDMLVHQMDAVSAYLNGTLKETVYMQQPEGFGDGTGNVCKLVKSIYGLKQSGRVWNETLNRKLLAMGLERSNVDQCIYHKVEEDQLLYVAVYVDDILIFSNNIKMIRALKKKLASSFKMKDMGEASSVLGMKITRSEDSIKIDQAKYISDVLTRFGMNDCNPTATPMDYNQKLSATMSPKDDDGKRRMSEVPYMQAIGCLLFAAKISRPDICYAVNLLSRFGTNPGKPHWEAVKRVMRYLKGTLDRGLVYKQQPDDNIEGYCDADWAGNVDDRQSTTGYVFVHQSAAISWATKKQKTVALSSTEAEFMAITAAIQESVWLKRLEADLCPGSKNRITIHCDNKGAIHVALNSNYSSRTKHVDIKAKFIRQKIDDEEVHLEYLSTSEMIADVLTKAVTPPKLKYFRDKFGIC